MPARVSLAKAEALNLSVLSYILLEYLGSLVLLLQPSWGLSLLGMLLLIHGLVLSAAAIHELIHGNFFKARWANDWAGQLMTHLNGACYSPYSELVQHHLNHHIHHADFVPFGIAAFIQGLPQPVRRLWVALEWAYFPLFEFWLRWRKMVAAWVEPDQAHGRGRALGLMLYRGALFAWLGWISPRALLLYGLGYVCFVNLMRFVDAFHHTYDSVVVGEKIPQRDRRYEQAHTFSNVVSGKYQWLNLLYLNFGYHNAHHQDMRCPWYRLPALHRSLYGEEPKALLPLHQVMGNYHRFRCDRLTGGQGAVADGEATGANGLEAFTGGIGVSFLTPH
jgi:fatty acid desaturase